MYNNKIQCVSVSKNRTRNSSTVHMTMLDVIMRYFVEWQCKKSLWSYYYV